MILPNESPQSQWLTGRTAIIYADTYSRRFEASRHPEKNYQDDSENIQEQLRSQMSSTDRTKKWLSDNRYSIVVGSWVASISAALGIVGKNPYLTGQQKLVQARVYAQGLTLAVVIISLAFETSDSRAGKGRWETVKILDPNDPTHKHVIEKKIHHERYEGEDQWMDMIAAEEERIKERERGVKEMEEKDKKSGKHEKHEEKGKGKGKQEKSMKEQRDDMLHGSKAEEDKDKKVNAP